MDLPCSSSRMNRVNFFKRVAPSNRALFSQSSESSRAKNQGTNNHTSEKSGTRTVAPLLEAVGREIWSFQCLGTADDRCQRQRGSPSLLPPSLHDSRFPVHVCSCHIRTLMKLGLILVVSLLKQTHTPKGPTSK